MSLFKRKVQLPPLPKHDLERFKARVGLLAQDDPLWPMLRAWLRANLEIETEAVAKPDVKDGEAHRARGRVGMVLDMEAQLKQVWEDSHQ